VQWGGGRSGDDDLDQQAMLVADELRSSLGEQVPKPGLAAIKAVLSMRKNAALTQLTVMKQFGTTKPSIRKYRALLDKLLAVVGSAAGATMSIDAVMPTASAAGVAAAAVVATSGALLLVAQKPQQ